MRVERARYLLAIVQAGSLRAAARRLDVSESTLSEQLTALEEELDCLLLFRSRRGVVATPAAEALLPGLEALVAAEDAVFESARALRGGLRGVVRVGAAPALARVVDSAEVSLLRRQHPEITIAITEGDPQSLLEGIAAGRLDFAVLTLATTHQPSHEVRVTRLRTIALGAFVPPSHPLSTRTRLTWADLASEPIVTVRQGSTVWRSLHDHLPDARVIATLATLDRVEQMAARGEAIGIGPRMGPMELGSTPWLPVEDTHFHLVLAQRTHTHQTAGVAYVRDVVRRSTLDLTREWQPHQ